MMGGPNAKLLRQMQAQLAKIQEELAEETVEATAGGGAAARPRQASPISTGAPPVRAPTR